MRCIGHDASVALSETDFLDTLLTEVPETKSVVGEHLEDYDGLLLHLLTADLRRFAIESFDAGRSDVLARLLRVIDAALREGTDDVQNAMAVSFVEDTGWWEPSMQRFIDTWPTGLQSEVRSQRGHSA